MAQEATQSEIKIWEIENQHKIVKWIKDFDKNTIQFCFDEKCTESTIFKIINKS